MSGICLVRLCRLVIKIIIKTLSLPIIRTPVHHQCKISATFIIISSQWNNHCMIFYL